MKTITTILLTILTFFSVKSQTLPDKIKVVKNTYAYSALDKIALDKSDTIVLTNKRKVSKLFSELVKYDNEEQVLEKFEIDTAFIRNHPDYVLSLYDGKEKIDWNKKQKEFILKKLNDINVLKEELNNYISNYKPKNTYHRFSISRLLKFHRVTICGMGMPVYRSEFVVMVYYKNDIANTFTSSRRTSGYYFPFKDQQNRVIYNYKIDKQLNEIFERKIKVDEPLKGNKLLKYIVNQIVVNHIRELYKLSGYSYENEISELSSDFNIVSSEEVYGRGRYIWSEPKTIKITLKNKDMLPNVQIQFLASVVGNSIYSRDSIKAKYKDVLNKVQSLDFITEYLKKDTSATLDIYFFNNSAINEYNILNINKTPEEWEMHDKYVKSLKWYEKSDIKPSFDIKQSIATSQRNNCGCNLRKEKSFFNEAVFFEIKSAGNPSSIWFLLPDRTVLLYHLDAYVVEGTHVLDKDLSSLTSDLYLPFTCLFFNDKGELIGK
ncbi:MAG TPA: hypothetical protein DCQ50_08950 [Chryseobacterium sp.]|nr:hypothetical protein [Chryseobacterium sp.]